MDQSLVPTTNMDVQYKRNSDVCSVTCLCGHVMFVVFLVEPLLCGGMGSEGGGRSSEGGAGWEDRWREAAEEAAGSLHC